MSWDGGDSPVPLDPRVRDLLSHITNTPVRGELLSVVADTSLDLRDLSDALDKPRTTVRHNLQQMLDEGLIEDTLDNEYRASALGHAVLIGLKSLNEHLETAIRMEPLFECVSPGDLRINIDHLSDARVTTASPAEPFAPHQRLSQHIRTATSIRGYFPTNPFLLGTEDAQFLDRATTDAVLLVTPAVADCLLSEMEDALAMAAKRSCLELLVVPDGTTKYSVAIADNRCLLLGLDDKQKPHVLVETENERCVEWAHARLESIRTNAPPQHEFAASTAAIEPGE